MKQKIPFLKSTSNYWAIILGLLLIQGVHAQTRSLPSVLEALSEHYKVFFSYDADLLLKEQSDFKIKHSETTEIAIDRLLTKAGFSYDRFEEKYYVIYQKGFERPTSLPTQVEKPTQRKKQTKKRKQQKLLSSMLLDAEEGIPISDAFIFIRNTSISTTSDLSGTFQLEVGDFARGELVITHLNYKTLTFSLSEMTSLPEVIPLSPKNLAFAEVKVKAKRLNSKKRKQWLKQFTKALFGEGFNRRGMKLLNPEVVWFQEKEGELVAEAVDYLSIYNPSLGYQLRFYLEEFRTKGEDQIVYTGKVYFEDKKVALAIKRQANAIKIERKRKKTHQRSKKYFFRGLLTGDLDSEQFPFGEAILDENRRVLYFNPLTLDSLILKRGLFQDTLLTDNFFAFSNKKMIATWGRTSALNNYATCYLFAKEGRIILDHSGEIVNPKEIIEVGYWTTRRLANLMPMEYNFVRPLVGGKEADDVVSSLANKVNKLPQEKVYLHLNKPFYSLTESIWFKAYLCNAHNHSNNTLSKVVYVDLIDPTGEITKSWILHKDKVMAGDFRFNNRHQAGEYQIRAYTQYMQNEAPEFFFQKSFWVYDYGIKGEAVTTNKTQPIVPFFHRLKVIFYPEGGQLINGLSNNIAFKVTDNEGKPLEVSGKIKVETEETITNIKTQHEGLGLFNLTPKAGKVYKAEFEYNGTYFSFHLPKIQTEGMVMRVNNRNPKKVFIDIQATNEDLIDGAFLVGHVRGQIFCFFEEIEHGTPILFSKKSVPTGLAHFTLFDGKYRPIAERLIFNEVGMETDVISLKADKVKYQPREKVELEIVSQLKEKMADLSVSITDQSIVNYSLFSDNLPSYLLLNSDLPKTIPNVNFYLQDMDKPKRYWLDLYLMTYGWRRFNWSDLMETEKPALAFSPETGYSLKGYTTEKKNPDKRLPAQVMLTSLNNNFLYETQSTDEFGNFHFRNLPYLDSISFIIQGRIQNNKNTLDNRSEKVEMEGERMIDFHFETIGKPKIELNQTKEKRELNSQLLEKYLNYEKQSNTLDSIYNSIWNIDFDQEIVVKAKRKRPFKFGNTYDLNQMDWVHPQKNGTSLMSYLYPRFNYEIDFQKGKLYLVQGRKKTPLSISINGMGADKNGSNPARFLSLNADLIDYVFFDRKCSCISITTRDIPRSLQIKLESGILNVDHPGYLKAREFYAPDYSQSLPIHQAPDLRTAIHWAPTIELTKDQPAKLSFYAADTPTTYEIRVEGLTADGKPIFKTMHLEVE